MLIDVEKKKKKKARMFGIKKVKKWYERVKKKLFYNYFFIQIIIKSE
jgi:hypothetical protein